MDMVKSNWVYRKLRNFRAGIVRHLVLEARLWSGALRLARLDHFRAYVWSSVFAYNLALFARLNRSDSRLRQTLAGPLIPGRSLIRTLRPSRRISPRNRQMDQNGVANRSPLAINAAREANKNKRLWTGTSLEANLFAANLRGADLRGARLTSGANFSWADLSKAKLNGATLNRTILAGANLSNVTGLETCVHDGPSVVDHRTLELSGRLPLRFLRGVGLPDY